MNKSALFRNYNAAKTLDLDKGRLNRALGVAQSSKQTEYITTATSCTCPDARYRRTTCKHQIAKLLVSVA